MYRLAVLLAALLLTAACGSEPRPPAATPGAQAGEASSRYDFTGTTLAGEPFAGRTLEGKPAVLWFWAPWCPTCRSQIPHVSALAKKYDGRVAVVGVGGLDGQEAIEELAREIPHVTHLVDAEGAVWRHFGVTAQSTFTVLDGQGQVVSEGYLEADDLVDLVERLAG